MRQRFKRQSASMETRVSMEGGYPITIEPGGPVDSTVYPVVPVGDRSLGLDGCVTCVRVTTYEDECWYCQRGLCSQWLVYDLLAAYVLHTAAGAA